MFVFFSDSENWEWIKVYFLLMKNSSGLDFKFCHQLIIFINETKLNGHLKTCKNFMEYTKKKHLALFM